MFVRVKEKIKNYSYKSIVYGIIDKGGYSKYIVIDPIIKSFIFVSYLPEDTKDYLNPQVQIINGNTKNFIEKERVMLLKLKKNFKETKTIDSFFGLESVFHHQEFISLLCSNREIPFDKAGIDIIELEDKLEWNYIDTQEDANSFMKLFVGFHDSTIERICYEEDYHNKKLTMTVDNSGWYGIVELCFEGLISLNLRPPQENLSRELYCASLIVKDNMIFWADDMLEDEDLNYKFSFIKALNLKWRKLK